MAGGRSDADFIPYMSGKKIDTNGGNGLGQNPFGMLNLGALPTKQPDHPNPPTTNKTSAEEPKKSRGRVDIVREKAGRGGKTVTVISGFIGIGLPEKEMLAKKIQRACGVGGTVKDGRIEIQGDSREVAAKILTEAGFKPVFAGG